MVQFSETTGDRTKEIVRRRHGRVKGERGVGLSAGWWNGLPAGAAAGVEGALGGGKIPGRKSLDRFRGGRRILRQEGRSGVLCPGESGNFEYEVLR
jgi:hypothetical protein